METSAVTEMNLSDLRQELIAYSETIGVDKIGFAAADPFDYLRERLYQQQTLRYQSGFEEKDIEKRTRPGLILDGAASIIAIALAYPAKMEEKPANRPGERRGSFSRASWGVDYHHILREKLEKLESFLSERVPGFKCKAMVDTGELSDRAVAERAGIGAAGKNTNLITREFGSYVYLGEMITNIPFEADEPIGDLCGDCTICIDRCPTGAIVEGGRLNANKCIAFLTQTKTGIPEPYRKAFGNRVYGCDTCQQVCPYNKGKDFHFHEEMEPDPELVKPLLVSLLDHSNKSFKKKYGYMAGSWRGKNPIQRNAVIALGNYKEIASVQQLSELLKNDPRPAIRESCVWSLGEIAVKCDEQERSDILDLLTGKKSMEEDESVQRELQQVILKLRRESENC